MIIETPVGPITLGYIKGTLICTFGKGKIDCEPSKKLGNQLRDFLRGKVIKKFDVTTPQATPFTNRCWEACRNITYGNTVTYKELAKRAGSPKANRAAGQAMKKNPMVILTPCHRVIASSGALHGFAGTTNPKSIELQRKEFLLDLEQSTIRR